MEERQHYTLSMLADAIKAAFNHHLAPDYWVRTEIHKLNVYRATGHCYMELVDKVQGATRAKINATAWNTTYERITQNFYRIARMPLNEGMEVLMRVQVRFHEVYGLSLNILDIDPTFSMGQMARMRLETLQQLKAEGLLQQNISLPFPEIPSRIAVISAASSKGYKDFLMKVAEAITRYKFRLELTLFPALLDGDNAIRTIPQQIRTINASGKYDVICLIRGGGGEVGLSGYDHIDIARAICTSAIPVVSGIGHATNETVAEMVSNKHCITPTDVGNLLTQKFVGILLELQDLKEDLERLADAAVFDAFQRLELLVTHFKKDTRSRLLLEKSTLRTLGVRMSILPTNTLKNARAFLDFNATHIEKQTQKQIFEATQALQMLGMQADKGQQLHLKNQHQMLLQLAEKLRILDPQSVLKRGFSITTNEAGAPITNADEVPQGAMLQTTFYKGRVTSKVIKEP